MPPISVAVCLGYMDVLNILLDAKADVNTTAGDIGRPPLVWAAQTGHWDMLKVLLDHKADPNKKGGQGLTALLLATGAGEVKSVEALLSGQSGSQTLRTTRGGCRCRRRGMWSCGKCWWRRVRM